MDATPGHAISPPAAQRRFRTLVLALLAAALLVRVLILAEAWRDNPFARAPQNDARVYWDAAARIAAGQWTDADPFFSAPLYEYFVAAVRAAGGGLLALYAVQIALHLATAALLADIARRRFDAPTGLLACALFLLLMEPAFFATRVLNCTLQLALACLLWWQIIRVQERPTIARALAAGAILGLNCLATPPMMALVVLAGPWLWWQLGRGASAATRALAAVAVAAAVISPATIHNYRATGAFIPIQAAAGVTFRFGNTPGATGVFQGAVGVSTSRERMHTDAAAAFRERFGREGDWKEINDYFTRQALDFWRDDPAAAIRLALRKAWWFLTGRHYGDIYLPTLERRDGLARLLAAAPLPVPWLLGPAIVVAATLARRAGRFAPELALLLLPAVVVTAFWYSPRFRFPAVGVAVVFAAHGLTSLRVPGRRLRAAAVLGALAAAIAFTEINRATDFDSPRIVGPAYVLKLADACDQLGRTDEAVRRLKPLADAGLPESPAATHQLLDLLERSARWSDLADACGDALARTPDDPALHLRLGNALLADGRTDAALESLRRAVALRPEGLAEHNALGLALVQAGDLESALAEFESAIRLAHLTADARAQAAAHANLASALLRRNAPGDLERAMDEFLAALLADPGLTQVRLGLATLCSRQGLHRRAADLLREGIPLAAGPDRCLLLNNLAWKLATAPTADVRDAPEALRLAQQLLDQCGDADPNALDTLAAAHAESGRFDRALDAIDRAIDRARAAGRADLVAQFESRRRLYEQRRPFRAE